MSNGFPVKGLYETALSRAERVPNPVIAAIATACAASPYASPVSRQVSTFPIPGLLFKMYRYGRSLSRDLVFEAHHKQKEPHDPMWPVRFVGLHPRDAPIRRFKDEYLREVELHPLFHNMVCCRLYCRALPVLGLE